MYVTEVDQQNIMAPHKNIYIHNKIPVTIGQSDVGILCTVASFSDHPVTNNITR